jgi:hypothetical protein
MAENKFQRCEDPNCKSCLDATTCISCIDQHQFSEQGNCEILLDLKVVDIKYSRMEPKLTVYFNQALRNKGGLTSSLRTELKADGK